MKNIFTLFSLVFIFACSQSEVQSPSFHYALDNKTIENGIDPKVYSIAATRAVNKFLDGTKIVYEQNPAPTLYIKDVIKEDSTLPDGFYYAGKKVRDIIEASRSYQVVNNINEASYYLDMWVSRSSPDARDLTYTLILSSADGQELGSWSETLKMLKNDDRSWW